MTWTDERVRLLSELWGAGLTATQIAEQIGDGITRSAVLGRVHRDGLSRVELSPEQRAARREKRRQRDRARDAARRAAQAIQQRGPSLRPLPPIEITTPASDFAIPLAQRRSIMTLGKCECQFPIGHPGAQDFFFCGAPTHDGHSYCSAHEARCYAAQPGTGPTGETCGSCRHLVRNHKSRTYLKCALMRAVWTGGYGTDVLARSPACSKWDRSE